MNVVGTFSWDDFKNNKVQVFLKTKQDILDFLTQAHKCGYKWCSGREALEFIPDEEKIYLSLSGGDMCWCGRKYDPAPYFIWEAPCPAEIKLLENQNITINVFVFNIKG